MSTGHGVPFWFLFKILTSVAACYFITVVFHLGVGSVPLRGKLFVLLYFSCVLYNAVWGL